MTGNILFLSVILFAAPPPVTLHCEKVGNDVKLTWVGSTPPYKAIACPRVTFSPPVLVLSDHAIFTATHVGAVSSGVKNWFYDVNPNPASIVTK